MSVMTGPTSRYLNTLIGGRRPVRTAALVLAEVLNSATPLRHRRRAAARAVAMAAALLPCALARHRVRRHGDLVAAWDVATKFGRPEDLDAPGIGVRAQFDRARLDPRLGGLLGDSADVMAAWLASGESITVVEGGRLLAAVAPLVLGALLRATATSPGLGSLLDEFPPESLERAPGLASAPDAAGRVFRAVHRHASRPRGFGWLPFQLRS